MANAARHPRTAWSSPEAGGSEKSHHLVALNLVHNAVVAMNSFLHNVQYRLHAPHRLLGVNRRNQPSGIPDIGEQHRQAFSFSAADAK